jgi:single-strand DNA-binding protein
MTGIDTTLEGNLVKDPLLRYTKDQKPVTVFPVAVSYRHQLPDGTWATDETRTTYVEVKIWGPTAEHAADSLRKGDSVIVTGPLVAKRWGHQDAAHGIVIEVTAKHIGVSLKWMPVTIRRDHYSAAPGSEQQPVNEPDAPPTDPRETP